MKSIRKNLDKVTGRIVRKSRIHPIIFEMMEPRTLLSGTYLTSDISNTWALGGTTSTGAITFDGTGNVTSGSLTNSDGTTTTITGGTDAVTTSGGVSASLTTNSSTISLLGTINATKDVVATNEQVTDGNTTTPGALDLLVNNTGTFTQADMAGTWNIAAQDYRGTITINAAGHVTGGQIYLEDNTHNASITGGTAVLNADGTGTLTFTTKFTGGDAAFASLSLNVTMGAAQDVVVGNSAAIGQTSGNSTVPAELTVLLKSAGTYASADVIGSSWNIDAANGSGSISFNNHGQVTGSFTDSDGNVSTITGNYSIGGNGTLVANLTFTDGATVTKESLFGAINRSKNLIALDRAIGNPANESSSLTVLTNPTNHIPTERAKATLLQSAFQTSAIEIQYSDIFTATQAHDLDGDPISFTITAAPAAAGTLTITHDDVTSAVVAGTTVMVAGDFLTYTPAPNVSGEVNVLTVLANDGAANAANACKIYMDASALPAVTITAGKALAIEAEAGELKGDGSFTITRTGNTASALTVTVTLGGNATLGTNYTLVGLDGSVASDTATVTILAGKSSATVLVEPIQDNTVDPLLTVTLTADADPNIVSPSYTPSVHATGHVGIVDSSPFVTITPRVKQITEGTSNQQVFIITRLPAEGANLDGNLTVNLSYSGTFDTADDLTGPTSVTFTAGQEKKIITISTTSDGIADPTQTIIATESGNFAIEGTGSASVNVLDDSPIVRMNTQQGTTFEAHPSVGGTIVVTRTGPTTDPLTVDFTTGGTATLTTNYTLTDQAGNTLTSNVTIPAGTNHATITVTPVDDFENDPTLTATLSLAADVGPTYHIAPVQNSGTVKILNFNRPPVIANTLVQQTTDEDTPISFTFDQLVTLTGATLAGGETNGTLQLELGRIFAGHLTITVGSNAPVAATAGTVISEGDTLTWTPPLHSHATNLAAFNLRALDGTVLSDQPSLFDMTMTAVVVG